MAEGIVRVRSADLARAIPLRAALIEGPGALPIVEYVLPDRKGLEDAPFLLAFAGGGSSSVVFARLMELLAGRGHRLVAFDMPGHTPEGLLGPRTPPRSLVRRTNARLRRRIATFMVERWADRAGGPVSLLSHSAGLIDLATLPTQLDPLVSRFWIAGAGLPGRESMARANAAAKAAGSQNRVSLWRLLLTREVPTGSLPIHFGPQANRLTDDVELGRYQGNEHLSVVTKLPSSRIIDRQDWSRRSVTAVNSRGDTIAPPAGGAALVARLQTLGVRSADASIVPLDRPHMFMCFEDGATWLADLIASR